MERAFREASRAARRFGDAKRGRRYQLRIKDLESAVCLADMSHYPGGCHALRENRLGQYAITLWGPMRLIIVPKHNPIARLADGGIDLLKVTAVEVLTAEDYHG